MQPPFGMNARAVLGAVAAVLLTAIVAVFGAFTWLQAIDAPHLADPHVAYDLGECRAYAEPVGAAGYRAQDEKMWGPWLLGADVGASARLSDGRMLWVFGDTLRAPSGTAMSVVRNSMAVTGLGCQRVVIPDSGREVIPNRSDGVGYWPMSILVEPDADSSTVHVFAERVRGGQEDFDFVTLGPAIATFVVPAGDAPELLAVRDLGPDVSARSNVGWGAAVADGGDGFRYIFGTANPDQPYVFGWSLRVARSRPEDIAHPDRWSYWAGDSWSRSPAAATPVIPAKGGVSQTLSVVEHGKRWFAISKLDGDLGTDLAVWEAAAPWGPFSEPISVGTVPNEEEPSVLRYMPLAHPDALQSGPGTMLVSISRNSLDPRVFVDKPQLYRPFFVDIELPPQPSQRFLDPRG